MVEEIVDVCVWGGGGGVGESIKSLEAGGVYHTILLAFTMSHSLI